MDVEETIQKIENIEIQGACSIAKAGVNLLKEAMKKEKNEKINEIVEKLKNARPTEPLLFNSIDYVKKYGNHDRVIKHIEESKRTIAINSLDVIGDKSVLYTHCHSSTVMDAIKLAGDKNDISVRATETRPLYQGRKTARELSEAGIPVKFYVDSGGRLALKESEAMLIGADAITEGGKVVNKIGSEVFAEVAQNLGVPVYVLADSWKADTNSKFKYDKNLERRNKEEIWPVPPKNVEIVNYAFEHVSPSVIDGIISEIGLHNPKEFIEIANKKYPKVL
ncbi:MAG: Ribose-15-bisphosphate isomerase E2B2, eIF-2B alpha/beta/delta family [Candidatus Methanohalarchaeum thermophilum]|uniref:Ribose-15-bisphosphate isomerase E2B2, eIF-2B alpha/beta/delta family n=1 Tax=Methanohalarchaeum thermophilum TaxID=1903181 RepID=A0A1Q6DS71_METT1|nr:MAG: Ribose-15-bisphosphate isomerase E2B2, eIF-2B alpha/beta/delta family [Candidatus Methanohalarchaeum thermophilum]